MGNSGAKRTLEQLIHERRQPTEEEAALAETVEATAEAESKITANPVIDRAPTPDELQKYAKKVLEENEKLKGELATQKLGLSELIKQYEEQKQLSEHQLTMWGKEQELNKKLEAKVKELTAEIAARPKIDVHTISSGDLRLIKITDDKAVEMENISKDDLREYSFVFQDATLAIMVKKTK